MQQLPPKLTAHLTKLEQAAKDVSLGQITLEEFLTLVSYFQNLFRTKLAEVEAIDIPDDFRDEMKPEMSAGRRGVELYISALYDFREYADSGDLQLLQIGLDKAREGNDLINEALRLNWTTYYTYRQAAEDYLAQLQKKGPT